MKSYSLFKNITIILFLLIIYLPMLQMTFNVFKISPLQENRKLATYPKLLSIEIANGEYVKKFENYFNDNFGLRALFIRIANYIDYNIFRHSNNPDVIVGKNNYLFYSHTLNDYNKISLTDKQIADIAYKLECLQNELRKQDIDFLFFVGPNKNTIYPEHMPIKRNSSNNLSNYQNLLSELEKRNINFIDLVPYLIKNKEYYDLYYKRDTHWNLTTSVLVSESILDKLNSVGKPKIITFKEESHIGDLDKMLGFNKSEKVLSPMIDFGDTSHKLPKTIWYHDSFSLNLFPYVKPYYSELLSFHYNEDTFANTFPNNINNTKLVVFEIVEREIPLLLSYNFSVFDQFIYNEIIENLNKESFNLNNPSNIVTANT